MGVTDGAGPLWHPSPVARVLAAALTIAVALAGCGADDPESTPADPAKFEDAPAPIAALNDQASELLDGGADAYEARLGKLEGYPVVVNKWASWCAPCRQEFPYFQRQSARLAKTVAFLGVNSNDNDEDAQNFLEEYPVPYPSYKDPSLDIADSSRESGSRRPPSTTRRASSSTRSRAATPRRPTSWRTSSATRASGRPAGAGPRGARAGARAARAGVLRRAGGGARGGPRRTRRAGDPAGRGRIRARGGHVPRARRRRRRAARPDGGRERCARPRGRSGDTGGRRAVRTRRRRPSDAATRATLCRGPVRRRPATRRTASRSSRRASRTCRWRSRLPELRLDPLSGLRTIVAGERAGRPGGEFAVEPRPPIDPESDPFLEGHEDRTPPEVHALRPNGGAAEYAGLARARGARTSTRRWAMPRPTPRRPRIHWRAGAASPTCSHRGRRSAGTR